MKSYRQQTEHVQPPPPASYSDRQFLHTYQSAAWVPLVQSTVNALMGSVLTGVALYLFGVSLYDYPKPMLLVFALTWAGSWLYLQRRWFNLTALESRLRMDLNGDGAIGKPTPKSEKEPTVIRIQEVKGNGHFQEKRASLPVTEEELILFADGVIHRGRPISRRAWTPKRNGFSDDEYRTFQAAMIRFGIIEQVGAGFELTRAGVSVMKYYASLSPTPVVDLSGE